MHLQSSAHTASTRSESDVECVEQRIARKKAQHPISLGRLAQVVTRNEEHYKALRAMLVSLGASMDPTQV